MFRRSLPSNSRLIIALAVAGAALLPKSAEAQITGTLDATLTLTSACAINGSLTTTGVDFGSLAFATQPALFTGILTAQANTSGSATQVRCSADVESLSITIGAGNNAGEGSTIGDGSRALKHETEDVYVPYELYSDEAMTIEYEADEAVEVAIASPGEAFDLPIYARINKTNPVGLAVGDYTDLVTITITF